MKHQITDELKSICLQILMKDYNLLEWSKIESSDQFQSKNYCGGFELLEQSFTFSYYDNSGNEFWFELKLEEVEQISKGLIDVIEVSNSN